MFILAIKPTSQGRSKGAEGFSNRPQRLLSPQCQRAHGRVVVDWPFQRETNHSPDFPIPPGTPPPSSYRETRAILARSTFAAAQRTSFCVCWAASCFCRRLITHGLVRCPRGQLTQGIMQKRRCSLRRLFMEPVEPVSGIRPSSSRFGKQVTL